MIEDHEEVYNQVLPEDVQMFAQDDLTERLDGESANNPWENANTLSTIGSHLGEEPHKFEGCFKIEFQGEELTVVLRPTRGKRVSISLRAIEAYLDYYFEEEPVAGTKRPRPE